MDIDATSQIGPGTILANRYVLADLIGRGGMGIVYQATDLRTGGDVVVKLLHPAIAGDPAFGTPAP